MKKIARTVLSSERDALVCAQHRMQNAMKSAMDRVAVLKEDIQLVRDIALAFKFRQTLKKGLLSVGSVPVLD